ncbi:DsbA family protein [Candidatus Parcubacteria bacterium]|nr:DsbA family protein [Candidatus Parcubacteria bacterium]
MDQQPEVSLDISRFILPGAIVLAALMISGSILYTKIESSGQLGAAIGDDNNAVIEVSTDDDQVLGDPKAPVTIIEFSDYQCPFCQSFWHDTFGVLKSTYIDTGKVKFVYRDFPLSSIHPSALVAAQAANCAREQDKYWQMSDKIFSQQDNLGTDKDLVRWGGEIGLDTKALAQCIASGKYTSEIDHDQQDGMAAGVDGTPTFFVNGKRLVGALPFSSFQSAIEKELNK